MEIRPGIELVSESAGTGPPVNISDRVRVRLNGWLNQGDAIQRDFLCEIMIGSRVVIPGIEYSLEGMQPGGKRRVESVLIWGTRTMG